MVHDPMTERYLYILITAIALLIFTISFFAIQMLYPLTTEVPFIVRTQDIMEELPRIRPLSHKGQNPDMAVVGFMVSHYVSLREDYDVMALDRNTIGVQAHSTPEVYQEYLRYLDLKNPESPVTLYQRHSTRRARLMQFSMLSMVEGRAEAVFEATVDNKTEQQKTQWIANISFSYKNIALDETTGRPKPLDFVVTSYHAKRLQDMQ